jgi:hypothetical protein
MSTPARKRHDPRPQLLQLRVEEDWYQGVACQCYLESYAAVVFQELTEMIACGRHGASRNPSLLYGDLIRR